MNYEIDTKHIKSKGDFINFLENLIRDFRTNGDKWENKSINDYLEAMKAFLSSVEGFKKNIKPDLETESINWELIADAFLAARIYE